jgi:phage tail-like protein
MNNIVEFHSGFRFTVAIDKVNHAVFSEFRLPSLQVETMDIKEGGQNQYVHKLPVRVNVGTAALKQGITRDFTLLNWYLQVLKGDLAGAMRQVTVTMYDVKRDGMIVWSFRNAYPVKWSGPTLKSDTSAVAIEELEFVHHGFDISKV